MPFIDQAELHERGSDSCPADTPVFAWLHFQPVDLFSEILADQSSIPANFLEGLREYYLLHILPDPSVLNLDTWR